MQNQTYLDICVYYKFLQLCQIQHMISLHELVRDYYKLDILFVIHQHMTLNKRHTTPIFPNYH